MTAMGAVPISRAAALDPQLPASQGYFGVGGPEFLPQGKVFVVPGMPIGSIAPPTLAIGVQWAPGQGGDTPGGGGAATLGQTTEVTTAWYVDGIVQAPRQAHKPGTVGPVGYRRGPA